LNKIILFLFALTPLFAFAKPVEVKLWHAFDGFIETVFEEAIEEFNDAHEGAYKVSAEKKGNYREVYEKGLAAFDSGNPPHILQIYEVATLSAMKKEGLFEPVGPLMGRFDGAFDPDVYIEAIRAFYSSPSGEMLSLPWNASTGILFYNKRAFKKAGLDPESPPKTWEEMERCFAALKEAGYDGFTTAWPYAYHLEHLSAWHDVPFATKENGFAGDGAQLCCNGPLHVHHLSRLAEWQKTGWFHYAGRFNEEPERLFSSGECAILLQGANRLPLIERNADFPIGVGYLPYWEQFVDAPANLNIGGASLWVMKDFSEEEYQAVVEFFNYLSSAEVQTLWHQKTGYLPITEAAYTHTKDAGFYENHPASEIAVLEVMQNAPTPHTKGIRLPNYVEIREIIAGGLEQAINGSVSAEEALESAIERSNQLLK